MPEVAEGTVPIFPTFQGFRSGVTREVDAAGSEGGSRFGKAFSAAVGGAAALFAGLKVRDYFVSGVKGASELEQSVGAVSAIFKDNAASINTWSDSAATDVGLTKNEFNELGSLIGAQLKNGGTAMDQLAPKTNDLIGLGADLSSMFGGDTRTAVEALSSALKGERDPIERYGVSLNQAKIDAEAAALGFEKVGGTLSSEANQAATLSLIMKQTADAHGNFASEADTVAGKQQRLNAIWQNGKTAISNAFLPALGSVQGFLLTKLPIALETAQKAVAEGAAGITAFGAAWKYNDGEITSAGFPGFMERAGFIGRRTFDFLQQGVTAFTNAWKYNDGEVTSSGFSGFMERFGYVARQAFDSAKNAFSGLSDAFKTGDFTGVKDAFSGFLAIAQPAGPILAEVGGSVAEMSGEIGGLVTGALPLLPPLLEGATSGMQFLAEHTGILKALIIGITGAFVIYKAAQAASNVAAVAQIPVDAARVASNFALAASNRSLTAATTGQTVAERASLASKVGSAAASLRQAAAAVAQRGAAVATAAATGAATAAQAAWTAATNTGAATAIRSAAAGVASRVAMTAGAVATGVATAAQWAWNAAMTANPIGIIIVAIAALVAALVFFFTQTDLGREIWANLIQFLTEAWANLKLGATLIFTALGEFFSNFWTNLKALFFAAVQGLVNLFLTWTPLGILINNFGAIVAFFTQLWTDVKTRFSEGVDGAVQFVRDLPGKALEALGNLKSKLADSGRDLIQGFIDGITGMLGNVGDAVGGVMDYVGDFFPHSPARRGQFSGSGWTRVKTAGLAIGDQFAGGVTGARSRVSSAMNALMSVPATPGPDDPGGRASRAGSADSGEAGPKVEVNVYPNPGQSEESIGNTAIDRVEGFMRRA